MSIRKIQRVKDGGWHRWFAWHPAETTCGNRVWLEHVERRWNTEKNFLIIDVYDPGDYDGGWDYRLIARATQPLPPPNEEV